MQGNYISQENYRLYSFVANGYISSLQCDLQTAHAIAQMSVKYNDDTLVDRAYRTWASEDHVIIICGAFNSKGVFDCAAELNRTGGALGLPVSIFFEDEDSLGGAATACAVVVPQKYWDTKFSPEVVYSSETIGRAPLVSEAYWSYLDERGYETKHPLTHPEGQFINRIKQYRLA